jgi:uncharacterized protein YkwD
MFLAGPPRPVATVRPEAKILGAVQAAYRHGKAPPLASDPALGAAAKALAKRAVAAGAKEAIDAETIAAELSLAGGWDPPPRIIVVRASPPARAAEAMEERSDLASTRATHLGVGFAVQGDSAAAVVLLSHRRAALERFPRRVAVGSKATLSGRLVFPLHDPRVFVTGPSGVERKDLAALQSRSRFSAEISFPEPGTYSIEVVAESGKGPEVAALFRVQAGQTRRSPAQAKEAPERDDLRKAESQVLSAINRRRSAQGLRPLARSALLDSVASEHCAEMARLKYFAHVSPVSGDAGDRLKKAGFRFERVAENLGEASSALEAHRLIEASPGHLANVLDSGVDRVGIGTARVKRGSEQNVLLTEIFASPARD